MKTEKLNVTLQPCCANHCRTWQETAGGLPPSDHSPMCENYKLEIYKRVTYPGSSGFIDTVDNVDAFMDDVKYDDEADEYKYEFIHMTADQFSKLPDFEGF